MKQFLYHRPTTVKDLVETLMELGPSAVPIAGGTDLVVQMKDGAVAPEHVVDVMGVPELRGIHAGEDGAVRIGSATTLKTLMESTLILDRLPILAEAARTMACAEVRGMATIGGNVCSAVPSADMAPPLLALDAGAVIAGPLGRRTVGLGELFVGPRRTCLGAGEVLVELSVPRLGSSWTGTYLKYGPRGGMDLAVTGVAVVVSWDTATPARVADIRVALGAVAPTAFRAASAEDVVREAGVVDERVAGLCGEAAEAEAKPISDIRASEAYRRTLVRVLTARALMTCLHRRDAR